VLNKITRALKIVLLMVFTPSPPRSSGRRVAFYWR
jgi:hypothetical protein